MSTLPKQSKTIDVREHRAETIAYSEYVKMKLERNQAVRELSHVITHIESLTFWQRLKFLINGKR